LTDDPRDHQIRELERRLRWANDGYQRLSRVLDDALAGWRTTIARWNADAAVRAADIKAQAACAEAAAALEKPQDAPVVQAVGHPPALSSRRYARRT
jgi:hypothetical protein